MKKISKLNNVKRFISEKGLNFEIIFPSNHFHFPSMTLFRAISGAIEGSTRVALDPSCVSYQN